MMVEKGESRADKKEVFRYGPRIFKYSLAGGLLLYLLSGIYVLQPGERGVVRRFGRVIYDSVMPGIHYHLPFPVDIVDRLKVKEVKRIGAGFKIEDQIRGIELTPEEYEFFTGDENIIKVEVTLQYMIKNPTKFLFRVVEPQQLVQKSAEAALTEIIISMKVDELLTTGRLKILNELKEKVQRDLAKYEIGIQLVATNFQKICPPREVEDAFRDVASARADKSKYINEAYGYRNDILPMARGRAQELVSEAESYKVNKISKAKGDAGRYLSILAEYEKSPGVTAKRLYIETMEQILPGFKKFIIEGTN